MPRTMRSHARPGTSVRGRHRSWMRSMTLATAGWAVVWGSLAAAKLGAPPPVNGVYLVAMAPALAGVAYALLSIRARKAWLFMAVVALFANGSLIALPFLFDAELRTALVR